MRMFITFTKKELLEQWKNYKILILFAMLAAFGMMSPVLAKIMPDIFSQIDMGAGVSFTVPEATFIDAYLQFFKNITQMCIIIVILIFSGNISQELQKGSAILMLSKGLSRITFIVSKFVSMVIVWTVGFIMSAVFCYVYTGFLFPGQLPQNLVISLFCLWLLVAFILSVITVTSVSSNQSYLPMVLTAGVLILLLIVNIFPRTTKFSPLALGTYNGDLLRGVKNTGDMLLPLIITVCLTGVCITAAIAVFRRRQL